MSIKSINCIQLELLLYFIPLWDSSVRGTESRLYSVPLPEIDAVLLFYVLGWSGDAMVLGTHLVMGGQRLRKIVG